MPRFKVLFFITVFASFLLVSCGDDAVSPLNTETVLYEKPGLVDSAVVYGCYAYTVRHFVPDTLDLASYSKIKVDFDGYANSDGTFISVLYHTNDSMNIQLYHVEDISQVNRLHSFEFTGALNRASFEVRFYINPPVCGTNEFKYIRARDLKITGVK